VKRDYDSYQRREEALHRHRLRFDYTVSALVHPSTWNPPDKSEQGEDEIDGSAI